MNAKPCSRCGFDVYPAEKINCIDQTWHKSCFHCEVCQMILTVNNFVSYEKKPYCHAHNPKNNTFTSVYETPLNVNAKKQSEAVSEIKYREEGERYKSFFHWDVKSRDLEHARRVGKLSSQNAYQAGYEEEKCWYSPAVPDPEMVRMAQAQKTLSDLKYTEGYEQQKGKGSFPAMITPAFQIARKANELASDVEYKRGHEERISQYTSVADTPHILHAKAGGQLLSDLKYTEDYYEQQRGKGSFPALITPAYQIAKKANELASDVKYHQRYQQEMRGKASHASGAEGAYQSSQDYLEEYDEVRGKGSFPAMITPAYQHAKKANDLASDIKYRKEFLKMKGPAQYHHLASEDNLVMKQAQNVNKLVSEVAYRKDLEHSKGHSINFCETPHFQNASKVSKYASDVKYKENYQNRMKGHYQGVCMDKRMMHAMKVGSLASDIAYKSDYKSDDMDYNYPATLAPSYQTTRKLIPLKDVNYRQHIDKVKFSSLSTTPEMIQAKINAQQLSNLNYRAQYEKNKANYTLPQDLPHLVKAKANAELFSGIKYREGWEKSKGKEFKITLNSISMLAAKASGDLASDLKYREAHGRSKGKVIGTTDSRLLHSLQVAKMSSEVEYKKGFEQSKTQFHIPLDMVNLKHAKKAQALASDLDYRKRLHRYTMPAEDMKVKWAKKAYGLQSELQYRADLTWMKGVGWMTEGSLDVQQAKKAGDLVSEKKYRQKADALRFTSVADSPQMKHAKKSQALQSHLTYKSEGEELRHHYTMHKDEPLFRQAKANAANLSATLYKSSWEKQKEKGFELRLDALSILTAKAKTDLASEVKYKEDYEKTKGKLIGVKEVSGDTQMAHSLQMSKMQSDLEYKKGFEDSKTRFHVSMDMMDLVHAKKAQTLATNQGYQTRLHDYSMLPTDMKVAWARRAYGLQSDNRYKADLNWMKGVGWMAAGSLTVKQAKKAGDLISETRYRQHPYALKFTSIKDTPEMIQARISYNQAVDRMYREQGENLKHHYTPTADSPEILQAKMNASNISETRYKESWTKLKDGGYKLKLDAIPFQAAKASGEIVSDLKYKEAYERMKGHASAGRGLEDDLSIAHSVHAASLQSNLNYKKGSEESRSQYRLPLDMVNLVHAKLAQSLVSDQDYKHLLHHYTALPDDMRLQCAKRAYELQSEKLYRSDLNFMRGVGCITPGALAIEGSLKASELISETKYRQQPHSFRHTAVTDSPDLLHAKFSSQITNERLYKAAGEDSLHRYTTTLGLPEFSRARINAANLSDVKYRESWHSLRGQGYRLTTEAIPFQTAKASHDIASDYQYKHNFVEEKGKHIGARSIFDDPKMLHCLQVAKLQSEQLYKKGFQDTRSQFHLPMDMVNLVHAKKAQGLASNQDYKTRLHDYTISADDMKIQCAKKAHELQSESRYKSDLNFMRGIAWETRGSPQIETVKKAGEIISEKKYRQNPGSMKFTSIVDPTGLVHAKSSYLQCSDRLYKLGDLQSMHRSSLPPDHPDFIRARLNAYHISDKAYKTSWEKTRAAGYDLRLDAIPFQTAKASREIASDFRYKEAFLRDKGHQIGFRSVNDDPKMKHFLHASKLQSEKEYKKESAEGRSQYKLSIDQPGFRHAKQSQQQASDVNYRQHLHQYTCDPEQLNLKHAREAYKLQSDVKYKSDLNWIKGVGWTPPGYHKVEMARRAAERVYAQEMDPRPCSADYERAKAMQAQRGDDPYQQMGVSPDASEMLQVRRKKMQPKRK